MGAPTCPQDLDTDNLDLDLSKIDFSDIESKYRVEFDAGLDTVLIVDNLPVVGASKEQKLLNLIIKKFSKHSKIKDDGVYMPMENGESKG